MALAFPLGRLVITRNALRHLELVDLYAALRRHALGDWGDVSSEDQAANCRALTHGERVLSVYHTEADVKFWIITEWDRSLTTILLPEDY